MLVFLTELVVYFCSQELPQLGGAEKIQLLVDVEEPATESGGTMINKGHVMKNASSLVATY
jgi:hypothetical protein